MRSKLDSLSAATESFAAAMEEVAASSEEQSASTEQIAAAAATLGAAAAHLAGLVGAFKLESRTAEMAIPPALPNADSATSTVQSASLQPA